MVQLLQLLGAITIEWTHVRSAASTRGDAADAADPAVHMRENVGFFKGLGLSVASAWLSCTTGGSVAAASVAVRAEAPAPPSALSGRVLHRLNARPPAASPAAFLASLGPAFYHVARSPAMQDQVVLRLTRGIVMAGAFSLQHDTPDSSRSLGFRALQLGSVPPGCVTSPRDEIACGYSAVGRGQWETFFRVMYPE